MRRTLLALCSITLSGFMLSSASAQELLKAVEPGTGYSHLKQWAIEHQLTFENFTKDTLLIRGAFSEGGGARYAVKLLARFCAGDDYSGRLFSATLQEFADSDKKSDIADAFAKERTYLDVLAGKTSEQGQFEGDYKLRREKISGMKGIAAGKSSDQGSWEVGLFFSSDYVVVQTTRHKDELCR